MPFFAAQVRTGGEEKFITLARKAVSPSVQLIWPRRSLRIRKGGRWLESLAPIFPGYIFIRAEAIEPECYRHIRRTPGFVHFLDSNENVTPLDQNDEAILTHFLSFGEIVDKSLVTFDENSLIRVISGPLRDLEGRIVRVDRRKGRARVKLQLYEDAFEVDFGFEVLTAIPAPPPGGGQKP